MDSITALAALRMPTGVSLLCIPKPVLARIFPFLLPYTGPIAVATRMLGCRDIALATLFYTRQARATATTTTDVEDPDPDRSATLKQALTAGIRADLLDVVAYRWCYGEGTLGAEGRGWGILSCLLWGCWGHRYW
ncbi:hypothetical protein BJX68DRAFT_260449 [Aspergillus pseudodeflectus]|uniref:Uncharacterized protein n=1 Tax=Aspergillus pseudodeflectus TaxID=176178 RepID=A0ABR4LAS9_9EURO